MEPEPVKNGPAPQQQDDGKMYVYWYTSVQTVYFEEPCHGNHFRRSVPVQSAGKLQFQADSELLLSRRTSAELELLLPPITSAKPENRVAKSILAVPEIPTSGKHATPPPPPETGGGLSYKRSTHEMNSQHKILK